MTDQSTTKNAAPGGTVRPIVLADAFLAGRAAFQSGVKVGDNPHPDTDERHWRWMSGWVEAADTAQRQNAAREGRRESEV